MSAIYILWLRDLRRYTRSRSQVVASLGQPILYILALGFGLGPVFQRAGEGSYLQFMAPGVIAMTLLFTSVFSGIGLLWDRQFGFLKETLVAPVPRVYIMIGRTLGGTTIAVVQATLVVIICLIAGFRPSNVLSIPLGFVLMTLVAFVFASLGVAIGSSLQDMQGFQLVMNFLVMPIYFLSGALFPLNNLPRGLAIATRIDPLAYGVDALRGALIGRAYFTITFDVLLLASVAVLFLAVGRHLFEKIEV
ncbi:MAG TPA: ABC transporter permease [Blastocatellia bacterium]|nr:ABC transporter permease [Blastocatellia bacterium]